MDVLKSKEVLVEQNTIDFIKKIVAEYFGLDESIYSLKTRKSNIVKTKQIAAYFIRKYLKNKPLTEIGKHFGNICHANILYCIGQVEASLTYDKRYISNIESLNSQIKSYFDRINSVNDNDSIVYFNDVFLLKLTGDRKILLSGFSNLEAEKYSKVLKAESNKKIQNTGMYLINKE